EAVGRRRLDAQEGAGLRMTSVGRSWASRGDGTLGGQRAAAAAQWGASLRSDLSYWSATLTGVVVHSWEQVGLAAPGHGYGRSIRPVRGNEYPSEDLMAFPTAGTGLRSRAPQISSRAPRDWASSRIRPGRLSATAGGLRIVFCYGPEPGAETGILGPA